MSFGVPDNYDAWETRERRLVQVQETHTVGCCAVCGEPVLDEEDYYSILGDLIHRDCILDWLDRYKK